MRKPLARFKKVTLKAEDNSTYTETTAEYIADMHISKRTPSDE